MNQEYINGLNDFIKEYNIFVRKDDYLQKREFYNLSKQYGKVLLEIDKYKDFIPLNTYNSIKKLLNDTKFSWIDYHNKQYIIRKLNEEKEYFDNLFTKYGIPIILDEEQRKAIIADCEASLIIAGAGTGKTTTMAAKVKYLVDRRKIKPEKILVLSYTKKAVGELKRLIRDTFKIDANITTFHALGRKIVKDKYVTGIETIDKNKQREIITEYVKNILFPNKELLKTIISIYDDCFSKEFKENCYKYKDFNEYFNNYKEERYKEEDKKGKVEIYIKNKELSFLSQDNPRGLDFRIYRSKKEAEIANFLYKNNIEYKYEIPAPFKTIECISYNPDFTIEINGKKVVIEYLGLTHYSKDGKYESEEIAKYQEDVIKKQNILEKHYTDHIFLDDTDSNILIEKLRLELEKRGIAFKKRDKKEMYFHLLDNFIEVSFQDFIKEIIDTIKKLKENGAKDDTFSKIIEFYKDNSNSPDDFNQKLKNIHFIRDMYYYYQGVLKKRNGIDFADMINEAYEFLKSDSNNDNLPRYEYLLIDEYQDVSFSRFLLARQIVQSFKTKIVAVGDDWQTIFTFTGSNIKLFYNFKKQFPIVEEHKITRTYRNSQELIDTAGTFVLKNKEQIEKTLVSDKMMENPIEIVYYDTPVLELDVLCSILDKIYIENKNDTILILTRRNSTIKKLENDKRFHKLSDTKIRYNKYPDLKIDVLTIHKAKGLTCDQAIVLDLRNGVFPSTKMEKNIVYHFYKRTYIWQEDFPFAEERRLFYVALTRTKNKVYLLAPESEKEKSIFVKEIKNYDNVVETNDVVDIL